MTETPFDAQSFQILVENIEDYAIFFLDPQGNVATWNKGAQRLKGYNANEILGRSFKVFYSEEDLQSRKPELELETARAHGRVEDEGLADSKRWLPFLGQRCDHDDL